MSICNKISKNIIEKPVLSLDEFKSYFLSNNYDENMFNNDGSLNPNYNSKKKTGIIAQIFNDHWNNLPSYIKHNILNIKPNADKEINKIIDCYNKNLGCSVYFCNDCNQFTFVGHTCKSRFCTSCGYKYKLSRVENIVQTAYNCKHRHIVFTCAKELWPYFFVNFDKMINIYFDAVNLTINSILNVSYKKVNGKLKQYVSKIKKSPGFFAFLHTFGRDLKWHPHIHVLIAEIALTNSKCIKWEYFDFNALSKRFMKILLDLMSEQLGPSFNNIKNFLYKKYTNGFYVYAEKKKFKNLKDGVEYVTRYCGRPAISENRILNYDGLNVTFCYNDHKDNSYHEVTVTANEFMAILLRHLIPENFKTIRYYGFYKKKHKLHDTMNKMISDEKKKFRKQLLNHKMCILNFFHYNPYNCPKCGLTMKYFCEIEGGG